MRIIAVAGGSLMAGCAFIVGPPDYGAGAPSRATSPVDSADSGTTPPDPTPELTARVDTLLDRVELVIEIQDADGDIEGGTLVWTDGSAKSAPLAIPEDLDRWNPLTGEAVMLLDEPVPVDCSGASVERTYTVQVTDLAGNQSASEPAPLEIRVLDAGSAPGNGWVPLGDVTAPLMLCGTLDPLDDRARWRMIHHPGGTWTAQLAATGTGVHLEFKGQVEDTQLTPGRSAVLQLVDGADIKLDIDRAGAKGDAISYQVWMHR